MLFLFNFFACRTLWQRPPAMSLPAMHGFGWVFYQKSRKSLDLQVAQRLLLRCEISHNFLSSKREQCRIVTCKEKLMSKSVETRKSDAKQIEMVRFVRSQQTQTQRHLRKVSNLTTGNQILRMNCLSRRNAFQPCQLDILHSNYCRC